MKSNNFFKNLILHIKYPYTSLVIAAMWISMAIISTKQIENLEILIVTTAICTLVIAWLGFKSPK